MRVTAIKVALYTTVALVLVAALTATQFNKIAISCLSRSYNLEIYYDSLKGNILKNVVFQNLKAVDRASGNGIFAEAGSIALRWKGHGLSDIGLRIDLSGFNFVKNHPEHTTTYADLPDLVSSPFNSRWRYGEISADIEVEKDIVTIKRLEAVGDEIRLFLSGRIYPNKKIESDIRILFSSKLTSRIPEELSDAVLQDEPHGWKSLSVKLSGNYKDPSIQITGKLFRLNIKSISTDAQ